MLELLGFISYLLNWYSYIVIGVVIMGWLLAFNVINGRNQFVQSLWSLMVAMTEPLLGPIRRIMPNLGPVDISPVILLFGIVFLQSVVLPNLAKLF